MEPTKECVTRLTRELQNLQTHPVDGMVCVPDECSVILVHFAILGQEDTPFYGGVYRGEIRFPPDYPHSPPSITMATPSGRFEPNKNLCLSFTEYHKELWSPAWTLESLLVGFVSFMNDCSEEACRAIGGLQTPVGLKLQLATQSAQFNATDPVFCRVFPFLVED
jgi:ubiquitin-conjugating enzyme E2 J2